MVDKDKISVIVPVYNDAKYLDRCVGSIRNQTYKNLDIILVDDGSKDDSGRLCNGYAKKDERIHVIRKTNGGLVSAWKTGFESAKGDYVCFVDGDDWIENDMIAKMACELSADERYRDSQVICDSCVIDRPDGSAEKMHHGLSSGVYTADKTGDSAGNDETDSLSSIHENILGNEKRTIIMSRCMKLISKKLIEQNLTYADETVTMGEDVTIMLPALLDAERIVIMKDTYDYHYVYNTGSMVHAYDPGMIDNIHRVDALIRKIFGDKGVESGVMQAKKEYLYLMIIAMKNELRNPDKRYSTNIRSICEKERFSDRMQQTPIEVHDTANWMIANMMMHPQGWVIWAARAAMNRKMKQNTKA